MRSLSATQSFNENDPDEITWNPHSSAEHKKTDHKIDLSEVFRALQLFSQSDLI